MADNPAALPAITPVRMKPAWATAEYASIRLTSVCVTAVTVPTTIVRIATTHSTGRQPWLSAGTAT